MNPTESHVYPYFWYASTALDSNGALANMSQGFGWSALPSARFFAGMSTAQHGNPLGTGRGGFVLLLSNGAFAKVKDRSSDVMLTEENSIVGGEGEVSFDPGNNSVTLTTGSPSFLTSFVETDIVVNALSFDYEWLSEATGPITVYLNGEQISYLDSSQTLGFENSLETATVGRSDVDFLVFEEVQPGMQSLLFHVDTGGTGEQAQVQISNVEFVFVEEVELDLSVVAGDFNRDDNIDGIDLEFWQSSYGLSEEEYFSGADASGDKEIDGVDFLMWQQMAGASLGPDANSIPIPEPKTILMALCAVLSVISRTKPALQAMQN